MDVQSEVGRASHGLLGPTCENGFHLPSQALSASPSIPTYLELALAAMSHQPQ